MEHKIKRHLLTEELYGVLKEQILKHILPPGSKVNIDQLARQFEVSNIPIREALSRLASEGWIDIVPFKGMFVTDLTISDYDEICELRIHLECFALQKSAMRIPSDVLRQLKDKMKLWVESESLDKEEKLSRVFEMNLSLHGLLLSYCGNKQLEHLVGSYIEKIQRYLTLSDSDISSAALYQEWIEHSAVIDYLEAEDSYRAEMALKQHLQSSYERTRKLLFGTEAAME
jgi:DNA-binding GntR family transcriptional regulator